MKVALLVSVVFYQILEDMGCGPRARNPSYSDSIAAWNYYVNYSKPETYKPSKTYNKVPDDDKAHYGRWLIRHMYKKLIRPPEIEWPQVPMYQGWVGWGHGEPGQNPPPWSINYNSHGKPKFCLYDLEAGPCKKRIPHWGFSTKLGRCTSFMWSGCGGNRNRFWRKVDCEFHCGTDMHMYHGCGEP